MSVEQQLKEIIKNNYGSIRKFSQKIGLSDSTVGGVLRSDMKSANIATLFAITKELGIDTESLYEGRIVYLSDLKNDLTTLINDFATQLQKGSYTIRGQRLTSDDIDEIIDNVNFAVDRVSKRHT